MVVQGPQFKAAHAYLLTSKSGNLTELLKEIYINLVLEKMWF